jgi:RimJ/RimL family protein N-acetyltransferase
LLPLTSEYLDEIHGVWTHPDVRRYLWDEAKVSREKAAVVVRESEAGFRDRGCGIWWVLERSSGEGIGFCGFRFSGNAELVYGLLPEYWHRGLATEAARAVIGYGFERVGLHRVTASADTANGASMRVMERAGMRYAWRQTVDGRDLTGYELSREEFDPTGEPG